MFRCVELVHEELERIIQSCMSKELRRFPRLVEQLKEAVSGKIASRLDPTKQFIQGKSLKRFFLVQKKILKKSLNLLALLNFFESFVHKSIINRLFFFCT